MSVHHSSSGPLPEPGLAAAVPPSGCRRPDGIAPDSITVDEFYHVMADGQKADLLDGVIHVASPDSLRANDITAFVSI